MSLLEKPEGDEPYPQVSRPVFLDTGGLDGRQAGLRREIDRLKACQERYDHLVRQAVTVCVEQDVPLPPHFARWQERASSYETHAGAVGRNMSHVIASWPIWLPTC